MAGIARDMHDDLNEQPAALSLSISAIRRRSPGASETDDAPRELQQRTSGVIDQVRDFAYDLHPGMLDHVALLPALRTYCADFERQNSLDARFSADESLAPLSRDVAVCLSRVLQEGLRNIANHAGVRNASVSLTQATEVVELTIVDRGRGVDQNVGATRRGLGLLSIEERARLVGGTVRISSTHDGGTTLHLQVPAQ